MTVSILSARPSLEVLLDPAVLVGEVDLDFGAGREDPAPEWFLGGLADLAGEDHGHLVGSADGDVVGHQGLEERPGLAGRVEDDGPGDLDLPH